MVSAVEGIQLLPVLSVHKEMALRGAMDSVAGIILNQCVLNQVKVFKSYNWNLTNFFCAT